MICSTGSVLLGVLFRMELWCQPSLYQTRCHGEVYLPRLHGGDDVKAWAFCFHLQVKQP